MKSVADEREKKLGEDNDRNKLFSSLHIGGP